MVGRSLIERIEAHYVSGREPLEVPEWGEGPGKPLKVYAGPLTLAEKQQINKWSDDNNEGTARAVILKATDKNGDPLFTIEDLPTLLRKTDASIVERICFWISEGVDIDAPAGAIEELEKN